MSNFIFAVKGSIDSKHPFIAFSDEESAHRCVRQMHGKHTTASEYISRIPLYKSYEVFVGVDK